MRLVLWTVGALTFANMACSGFTAVGECRPGETAPCESECGPGTMECDSEGHWGLCAPPSDAECLPGDYGNCSFRPEDPPGMWFCDDTCRPGPCMALCIPGETFECDGECGPGIATCQDDGSWGTCLEFVIPECRPGEIERCPGDTSHRRCGDRCLFAPCDERTPCEESEISSCGSCASETCLPNGTWGACTADSSAVCTPRESEACEAPCGPGNRSCDERCGWTPCHEIEEVECHPGDRKMCPTTLYCGFAFQICGNSCEWMDCIETGD